MDSATTSRADEDWELRNDDGFVYKRKKRRLASAATASHLSSTGDGDQFQEAEQKQRKERKRKTLLKLKAKYQKEIHHWDFLSTFSRAMEETALQLGRQRQQTPSLASSPSHSPLDSAGGSTVDELLLQVEAQEAIIRNISNLCDVAEAMCHKQEQQFKQSLFDLPIWASPLELMKLPCLCERELLAGVMQLK